MVNVCLLTESISLGEEKNVVAVASVNLCQSLKSVVDFNFYQEKKLCSMCMCIPLHLSFFVLEVFSNLSFLFFWCVSAFLVGGGKFGRNENEAYQKGNLKLQQPQLWGFSPMENFCRAAERSGAYLKCSFLLLQCT